MRITKKEQMKNVKQQNMLCYDLCKILQGRAGERYADRLHGEGAVDTLLRIIRERDNAMTLLALDRLKQV